MFDRLLNAFLWLVVMGLITSTAGSALILGYRGTFILCAGRYPSGAIVIGLAVLLAWASYVLCRHGNDLMDR